jgi:hypothetical protein
LRLSRAVRYKKAIRYAIAVTLFCNQLPAIFMFLYAMYKEGIIGYNQVYLGIMASKNGYINHADIALMA